MAALFFLPHLNLTSRLWRDIMYLKVRREYGLQHSLEDN